MVTVQLDLLNLRQRDRAYNRNLFGYKAVYPLQG